MGSNRNVYEIFEEFKACKTKPDRIKVLKSNNTYALRNTLLGTFHPQVEFAIDEIPPYKIQENLPPGMSYGSITQAIPKIYLFMKKHPKLPPGLTPKRRNELLIQLLEGLEAKEAEVFANIIRKDQKIKYLTYDLVREAYAGLLPELTKPKRKLQSKTAADKKHSQSPQKSAPNTQV